MDPDYEDSPAPELPARPSRKLNLNEALAKTISSELNSRLSSIRGSGSSATPSRISGAQYRVEEEDDAPPIPPRGRVEDDAPPPVPPRGRVEEEEAPPPPVPPRGKNVKLSDESLEDYDIPEPPVRPKKPSRANVRMSEDSAEYFDVPDSPTRFAPTRRIDEEEEDEYIEDESRHPPQRPPPVPDRSSNEDLEDDDYDEYQSIRNSGIGFDKLGKQLVLLEQELQEKNEVISDLKSDYNDLCSEVKQLKETNRSNEDKIKQLKETNRSNEDKIKQLKETNRSSEDLIKQLKRENEALKSENKKLKQEIEDLKSSNKELKIDTERPESPSKSPTKTSPVKPPKPSPTKPSPTKSPSVNNGPAIPPKPSKKVCETMMETANSINSDEYDFGDSTKNKSTYEKEEDGSNNSSVNSSLDFLPGTSSRPLVLPTKSCVRKRGNRLSSAITERKSSKRVTSTLTEEPLTINLDSPMGDEKGHPLRKEASVPSKPSTPGPALPPKPRRIVDETTDSPVKSPRKKPSYDLYDEPASARNRVEEEEKKEEIVEEEEEEEEEDNERRREREEEEEEEEDRERRDSSKSYNDEEQEEEEDINPTLTRIHKIGRGLPMVTEGGLSTIKLRRREDSHSGQGRQLEHLDEAQAKKWIFETLKRDEMDGDLFEILHDGIVLCDLINTIRTDKQITPKKGKMRPWHIVNINAYLSGCVDLHIKTLFKAEELYEGEGMDRIVDNISELKYYAESKK